MKEKLTSTCALKRARQLYVSSGIFYEMLYYNCKMKTLLSSILADCMYFLTAERVALKWWVVSVTLRLYDPLWLLCLMFFLSQCYILSQKISSQNFCQKMCSHYRTLTTLAKEKCFQWAELSTAEILLKFGFLSLFTFFEYVCIRLYKM